MLALGTNKVFVATALEIVKLLPPLTLPASVVPPVLVSVTVFDAARANEPAKEPTGCPARPR